MPKILFPDSKKDWLESESIGTAFSESGKCKTIKDYADWGQAEKEKFPEREIGPTLKQTSLKWKTKELWAVLEEIEAECQTPGWDGYGADPVSQAALQELRKLITLLPRSLPSPHIVPEPTGAIALEWRRGEDMAFVLSVKGKKVINHIVILGSKANRYGVEEFTTAIPQFIQRELFSFFESEV